MYTDLVRGDLKHSEVKDRITGIQRDDDRDDAFNPDLSPVKSGKIKKLNMDN